MEIPTPHATTEVERFFRDHLKGVTEDCCTSCSTWIGIKDVFCTKQLRTEIEKAEATYTGWFLI